jgi:hypothetical protein
MEIPNSWMAYFMENPSINGWCKWVPLWLRKPPHDDLRLDRRPICMLRSYYHWFRQTSTMVRRGTRGISPKIGSCDVGITWNYSNLPRLGRWRPDWVVEELNPQPLRHTAYLNQAMNLVQGSKMSQFSWVEESTHDLTCYPVGCFLITSMWRVTHGFSYRKLWSTYGVFFTDTCYTPVN